MQIDVLLTDQLILQFPYIEREYESLKYLATLSSEDIWKFNQDGIAKTFVATASILDLPFYNKTILRELQSRSI